MAPTKYFFYYLIDRTYDIYYIIILYYRIETYIQTKKHQFNHLILHILDITEK